MSYCVLSFLIEVFLGHVGWCIPRHFDTLVLRANCSLAILWVIDPLVRTVQDMMDSVTKHLSTPSSNHLPLGYVLGMMGGVSWNFDAHDGVPLTLLQGVLQLGLSLAGWAVSTSTCKVLLRKVS